MNKTNKLPGIKTVNPEAISYFYGPQNEICYNLETDTVRVVIVNDGNDEQHIEKALTELYRSGILSNSKCINSR